MAAAATALFPDGRMRFVGGGRLGPTGSSGGRGGSDFQPYADGTKGELEAAQGRRSTPALKMEKEEIKAQKRPQGQDNVIFLMRRR